MDDVFRLMAARDESGALDAVRRLGAVDARNEHDLTPLMLAGVFGMPSVLVALLDLGADVDAMSRPGISVLMHVASLPRPGIIRTLLARGADVNAVGAEGRTALLCAVWSAESSAAVVRALVEGGADTSVRDQRYRLTPLEWAENGRRADMVEVLTTHSPP